MSLCPTFRLVIRYNKTLCRFAKYCSRECQRQDWPNHKNNCPLAGQPRLQLQQSNNPVFKDNFETLKRWMRIWQEMVIMYGLVGMDLFRYPDRLNTHM